ncbi:MAG: peroxiredoxin family protein [Planctomycetota bacterium]|jgi:hypothetical protein
MKIRHPQRRAGGQPGDRAIAPVLAAVVIAAAAVLTMPAPAVTHLQRGEVPPAIELPDLDGQVHRTADLRGRVVLLVFGELYHRKTLEACAAAGEIVGSGRFDEVPMTTLLVISEKGDAAGLRERAATLDPVITVLHDPTRRAFGDYRVAVMPSAVVIDRDGRVVHAVAGSTGRFADIVTDALLVASGSLSVERFDETLLAAAAAAGDERLVRVTRISGLARQLEHRGLDVLAEEKYREALELAPEHTVARLGLASLLLRTGRIAAAEREFNRVLEIEPDSAGGLLGLAHLHALRGGAEAAQAERICHEVLAVHPGEARAHYLLGLIHEQRDEAQEAAESYKRAAELLMERVGRAASRGATP